RALTAWAMGWQPAQRASGTSWLVPYLSVLMEDPYDAVRVIATRSLATVPGFANARFDPLATPDARAEAAQALRARWAGLAAEPRGRVESTLFDARGALPIYEIGRLHAQRDDRPLNLAE